MVKANPTTVTVNPSSQIVMLGDNFTIDVNMDFAENLSGYEIRLCFNNTVLNAQTLEYRGYLNEPTFMANHEISNISGYVVLAVLTINSASKTGGSPPPLATIRFLAVKAGHSQLHLNNTKLAGYQGKAILHENLDGEVTCEENVPEFPPAAILPLLLILTTLITITAKKQSPQKKRTK
jgi:hypothetical protein